MIYGDTILRILVERGDICNTYDGAINPASINLRLGDTFKRIKFDQPWIKLGGEVEYELSKERFIGRNNFDIPKLVENSKPFSKKVELTTDPIIAMRKTINIKAKEKIIFDLIICVSKDKEYVLNKIKKYMNIDNNKRTFELSKARVEAENRYLEITGKDIAMYQRLLNYIIGNNLNSSGNVYLEDIYPITELWKFGISGDFPIVFVKIKNVSDIDVISELVKAYEYFKTKNLEFDLVILNEEKEKYDSYVKDAILDAILNRNLAYMLNTKGGIYVLNNIKEQDVDLISVYSKLVIDAKNGNLNLQLNELDENIVKINKNDMIEKQELTQEERKDNLLLNNNLQYYNDFGGFSQDGKEYLIRVNKNENVPMPWSQILTNKNFGTVVTEGMAGYTWYKNSRLNRITSWSNNSVLDVPSEAIYIKDDETKKAWSLGLNPMPDNNDYYITYGFGYAKYLHESLRYKARSGNICS